MSGKKISKKQKEQKQQKTVWKVFWSRKVKLNTIFAQKIVVIFDNSFWRRLMSVFGIRIQNEIVIPDGL